MTEHFSSPQWVDLVRGLAADEVKGAMDTHLREGCPDCVEAYRLWRGMAAFAEDERAFTPPEGALRVAKSYLAEHGVTNAPPSRSEWSSRPVIIATLLVDTLSAVPAGVRASAAYSRHLLFGAKSLAIDLHIDSGSRPGWFLLSGQIIDKSNPDGPFGRAMVTLVEGDLPISTFETNEFGEFQCTFDLRNNMKLQVALDHDIVSLPLEVLFDPSPRPSTEKHQE